MTNPIDESNLLIFSLKTAKIIFAIGEGVLSKSTNIMSSLTQALLLFSDKVVNQDISYIQFQNHKMVFVKDNGLLALIMVPKDQISKEFLPAIRVTLTLLHNIVNDKTLFDTTSNKLKSFYKILQYPERGLYAFPKTLDGYKSALVFLAGLNFDLSLKSSNLAVIKENLFFFNPKNPKKLNLNNKQLLLLFGEDLIFENITEIPKINLTSDFKFLLPKIENSNKVIDLIGFIFGSDSNANKIKEIINKEENLDEIISTIIKVDSESVIEIAIHTISNFSKDVKIGKSLYQHFLNKLNSIEETDKKELPIAEKTPIEEIDKKEPPIAEKTPIEEMDKKEPPIAEKTPIEEIIKVSTKEIISEKIASKEETLTIPETVVEVPHSPPATMDVTSETPIPTPKEDFSNIASEFTSKMKDLYETDGEEEDVPLSITNKLTDEEILKLNYENEIRELAINKDQIMMESVNIYIDLKPYLSGNLGAEDKIKYRPSLQPFIGEDYNVNLKIKIHPYRHDDFKDAFNNFIGTNDYSIKVLENGVFEVKTNREEFPDLLRLTLWLMLIDYSYNVQLKLLTPTNFFNMKNGSICIIPGGITPERRKHLPSNISEVIEEEKLLKNKNDPISIIKTLDQILMGIHSKLKSGKSVGFVPRPTSNEIPLIFEFVLTLSELTGIGWSRW